MDDNTEKILAELSQRIKTEAERAAAEKEMAEQTRRLAEATRRREANIREVIQRYAGLGERIDGLLPLIIQLLQSLEADREWRDELADEISSIRHLVRLLLGLEMAEPEQRGEIIKEIQQYPEVDSKRRRLASHRRNLQILLEQEASCGGYPPLKLVNEIESIQEKIEILERELRKPHV